MSKKILIMSFGVIFIFLCCYLCITVGFVSANADVPPEPQEYTMTQVHNGQVINDSDTVTINSAEELGYFRDFVNGGGTPISLLASFNLMTNIELNENSENWDSWDWDNPANTWTPIGTDSNKFRGFFYGLGHTISGVYINTTDDYQGLFGYNDGSIYDLGVTNFLIKGGSPTAALVGYNERNIMGCFSGYGRISSDSIDATDSIGGLVGSGDDTGFIINSYNLGHVVGSATAGNHSRTGGIIGYNIGTIWNCYNAGSIMGSSDYIGSIVGYNDDSLEGDVMNSYWLIGSGGEASELMVDKFDEDGIFQTANNNENNQVSIVPEETTLRTALNAFVDWYNAEYPEEETEIQNLKRWVGGPLPTLAGIRTISFGEDSGIFDPAYSIPANYLEGTSVDLPTSANISKTGYTFNGWTLQESEWDENTNPYVTSVNVNDFGNKTFYAKWTINKYTVTWKNGDAVIETDEDVEFGTTLTYTGETPIKEADGGHTYSFSGWSPEIGSVQGDITYNAQFTATPIIDSTIEPEAENNLLWLWIVISVLGAMLIVLFVLWLFLYKRKIKFILDGKIVGEAKYKLNEQIIIPEDLAIYSWFIDEKETLLFAKQKMGLFGFKVYGDSEKEQKFVKVE